MIPIVDGWYPDYLRYGSTLSVVEFSLSQVRQFWCMGARLGPPQSTRSLASMRLINGHYARSWGYRIHPSMFICILAMCQMRKSEEPLVVHRSLTWWVIDVCGSSVILLAVHLARTTIEPLQRVSDKYRPTGSDQQEDLATLGSVQLKQTLAFWTLASRLPGERPLLETNGDILWTQQRSSGVRSERRRGPTVWNSLPDSLRDQALTSNSFRQSLKTNLFRRYHSAAHTAQ